MLRSSSESWRMMVHSMDEEKVEEIREIYREIRGEIESRIADFQELWEEERYEDIFDELVFCLFTPQSKARACWSAVEELKEKDMLGDGSEKEISDQINRVRFRNNKAGYVVEAREKFGDVLELKEKLASFDDSKEARRWVVENIKGLGYKEASHFLRNVGYAQDLAILDRHILRNLVEIGVINEEPKTLTKKRYLKIEEKMKDFSDEIGIPIHHLDLVLWYKEAGEVFK